jgi:hypothetical protein
MWWLVIDPDDNKLHDGELIDLDWYVNSDEPQVPLGRQLPVRTGDDLWFFDRRFRHICGLAHAAAEPYLYRRHEWWLPLRVNQEATRRLRSRPLSHRQAVFRSEPFRVRGEDYDPEKDPYLIRMVETDASRVNRHLAIVSGSRV